ncbi:hypothetical protein SAMN04487904_11322 [Actinopolyspora lacussalsi subsp. righensis]|uniref:Uncharacterized protein n=1 Tax=Actinopolyspora righensis TaxID=995060 RepID=A0A1I7BW80_9ACTN|nr:hypothetical protein [Actinopolyspora righensis]SFT91452.1 hypothetical protein SAMN04487904_11322 [Actinopolyspora righensis]
MSLLQDLAARMAAAHAALPAEHLHRARRVLAEVAERVATLSRTSQDHSLTHAYTGLAEAGREAEAAAECLTRAAEHLVAYLADPAGIPFPRDQEPATQRRTHDRSPSDTGPVLPPTRRFLAGTSHPTQSNYRHSDHHHR